MAKTKKNSRGIKVNLFGPNPTDLTKKKETEPQHKFGDVSKESDSKIDEEAVLDAKLSQLGFIRKKIPKDGACLFRAVSDQVFHTQVSHYKVRQMCVDHIVQKKEDYEPFVCVSGLPFDHYCFEMRKVNSWGGQVELQALSLILKKNFVIYSNQSEEPTIVDNNFKDNVLLCYYGNHYDCIAPQKQFSVEKMIQGLVYNLIDNIFKEVSSSDTNTATTTTTNTSTTTTATDNNNNNNNNSSEREYRNIGWECWLDELRDQEKQDQALAETLHTEANNYKELSGYYKKESQDDNWKSNGNRRGKNGSKTPSPHLGPQKGGKRGANNKNNEKTPVVEEVPPEHDEQNFPTLPPVKKVEKLPSESDVMVNPTVSPQVETPEATSSAATSSTEQSSSSSSSPQDSEENKEQATPPAAKAWGQTRNWGQVFTKPVRPVRKPQPTEAVDGDQTLDANGETVTTAAPTDGSEQHHDDVKKSEENNNVVASTSNNEEKSSRHSPAVRFASKKLETLTLDGDDIQFGSFPVPKESQDHHSNTHVNHSHTQHHDQHNGTTTTTTHTNHGNENGHPPTDHSHVTQPANGHPHYNNGPYHPNVPMQPPMAHYGGHPPSIYQPVYVPPYQPSGPTPVMAPGYGYPPEQLYYYGMGYPQVHYQPAHQPFPQPPPMMYVPSYGPPVHSTSPVQGTHPNKKGQGHKGTPPSSSAPTVKK